MVIRVLFFTSIVVLLFNLIFSCRSETPRKENGSVDGAVVYQRNCISCHGENGDAEIAGAKNLTVTQLNDKEIKHMIKNGSENGRMMPYKNLLSDEEIDALVSHVKSLKD